jgi:hypothetical protein
MTKGQLPLFAPMQCRTNSTVKDSRMVNCYKETLKDGIYAVKRPGKASYTITPALPYPGQGLWNYNNNLYAVCDGGLYQITGGTSSLLLSGLNNVNNISWVNTLPTTSPHPYMVFHDQVTGYNMDATGAINIIAKQINKVIITNGGAGYPAEGGTFTISGSISGSGAQGTYETYSGSIVNVTLTNPGSNYAGTLTVNFSGIGFEGTGTINNGGVSAGTILTITAVTSGSLYNGMVMSGTGVTGGTTLQQQLTSTETADATTTFVSDGTRNSKTVILASITNIAVNQLITGTGILTGSIVTAINTTTKEITISNAFTAQAVGTYNFYNQGKRGTYLVDISQLVSSTTIIGSVATVADAEVSLNSFPANPVPGLVYLDGYVFVMDSTGTVWQSDQENPTSWGALNDIRAGNEPDDGMGLAKHLNYVVAFKQWTTDFLYDAGNPTGSVLSLNLPAHLELGCADGDAIQEFENTVVWMATTKNGSRTIAMLEGLAPKTISTKAVENFLNASDLSGVYSWAYKVPGHTFYGLVLTDQDITLIYDLNEQEWHQWTTSKQFIGGGENYFECSFVTPFPYNTNNYFVLDAVNGLVFTLSPDNYVDPFGPITMRIVTNRLDFGTIDQKTNPCITLYGDNIQDVAQLRHTDNDYDNWSQYRNIDLGLQKPALYNNGRFRRRAWEFLYTGKNPLRLMKLELDLNGRVGQAQSQDHQ